MFGEHFCLQENEAIAKGVTLQRPRAATSTPLSASQRADTSSLSTTISLRDTAENEATAQLAKDYVS